MKGTMESTYGDNLIPGDAGNNVIPAGAQRSAGRSRTSAKKDVSVPTLHRMCRKASACPSRHSAILASGIHCGNGADLTGVNPRESGDGEDNMIMGQIPGKMRRLIPAALLIITSFCSCTHFDFTMRQMTLSKRPSKILVGHFERRQVSFNPYLVQNFRDAVTYELFRLGYAAEQYHGNGDARVPKVLVADRIREACTSRGADLFIQGAVSEQETGEFTDVTVYTLVTFTVHDGTGAKLGEGYLSGRDRLADVAVMRDVARRFVRELHGRINPLTK
ncbi:MAG: hypothetical protein JXA20_12660 [Spirochaetes bacterium]|nr:hypothetical protein [Spirochaetota bacterium]